MFFRDSHSHFQDVLHVLKSPVLRGSLPQTLERWSKGAFPRASNGMSWGGLSLDHLSVEELKFTNCNMVTFVTLGHGRASGISMVVTSETSIKVLITQHAPGSDHISRGEHRSIL